MSEKEKRIIKKLRENIPKMSDFDKGYILGKTESFSEKKEECKKKEVRSDGNCRERSKGTPSPY